MSPQRRIALVSVVAAVALIALKLTTGIATGSLGLISESVHSGTDLIAALLTFFAIGVALRPADVAHPYGHGKAEHLAALAEAAILVAVSLGIAYLAVSHLVGASEPRVEATWYALLVILIVIVVDLSRATVSLRAGRRHRSAALQANALHFGSDLAGSVAVLAGLLFVRAGFQKADSAAALFVSVLVLLAAGRLIRRNVDVLMDRAPADAREVARAAIAAIDPPVQLRRLRLRQAAGRHFADVVIGVSPGAAVGQGHAAADAVEGALARALPEIDVVVHVEPLAEDAELREQVQAAATSVPLVREVHNVTVLDVDGRTEVSLHLKLPGELSLQEAHETASAVEHAIGTSCPDVTAVRTHIEPLPRPAREAAVGGPETVADATAVRGAVVELTGTEPRELRFLRTDEGLVAHVTLTLPAHTSLESAHGLASEIERRIHDERPGIADVIVHTEP